MGHQRYAQAAAQIGLRDRRGPAGIACGDQILRFSGFLPGISGHHRRVGVGRGLGHLLALGVSLTVTLSAVAAGWLAGSLIQVVTVLGSAAMTLLLARLRRVPAPLLLAGWTGVGVLSSWLLAGPGIMAEHPHDPGSLHLVTTWVARIRSGEAGLDPALFRLDFLLILWLGGGWLSWCLERWRAPLPGLLPAVLGLSVTLVNLPAGQSPTLPSF